MTEPVFLSRPDAPRLAVRSRPGVGPALLFLPGFASDMAGAKAVAVDAWAAARGRACVRFDYRGCGLSEGRFEDGTIGTWLEDAAAVADSFAPGGFVGVGSSMGGWLALLLALARPERAAGLVLIAPAPDFTQWGLEATLSADERAALAREGRIERANPYGAAPTVYTAGLIADGRRHGLMAGAIAYRGPVRILHGQADAEVPWERSVELARRLQSADVQLTLVKDGDHRLSRPEDLRLLEQLLACWPPLPSR